VFKRLKQVGLGSFRLGNLSLFFFHLYIILLTHYYKITFLLCYDLAIKIVVWTPGGQTHSKSCPTELKLGPRV
jgi:hypothetical protein